MLAIIIFGIFGVGILAQNSENFPGEVCNMKAETGPCRALIPRYYYNSQEQSCQKFNYGGCAGNKNNFETEEECINFCNKSVTPRSSDITYQIPTPLFMQKTTTPTVPETLQKPSDTPKPKDTTTSKPNDTITTKRNDTTTTKPKDTTTSNSTTSKSKDTTSKQKTTTPPVDETLQKPNDTTPKPNDTTTP